MYFHVFFRESRFGLLWRAGLLVSGHLFVVSCIANACMQGAGMVKSKHCQEQEKTVWFNQLTERGRVQVLIQQWSQGSSFFSMRCGQPQNSWTKVSLMDVNVLDRLNEYCDKSGQSKTGAIERAITQYIDEYEDRNRILQEVVKRKAARSSVWWTERMKKETTPLGQKCDPAVVSCLFTSEKDNSEHTNYLTFTQYE